MKIGSKLFLFAFVILLSTDTSFAQITFGAPGGVPAEKSAKFNCVECGFSISTPGDMRGYSNIQFGATNAIGKGGMFSFSDDVAEYEIGCINLSEAGRKLGEADILGMLVPLASDYLKVPLEVKGTTATESPGKKVINIDAEYFSKYKIRYIITKERVYVFYARAQTKSALAKADKIFNSISFFSIADVVAVKLQQVTPAPLPRAPMPKIVQSDAGQNRLKGKVKYVKEESRDLSGTWFSADKKPDREDFYDLNGNLTKHIYYDYKGLPMTVNVYGFIDGFRVSNEADVKFDSTMKLTVVAPGPPRPAPKPLDTRYDIKYVAKYDAENRLIEESSYRNNGVLIGKYVYSYSNGEMQQLWYDRDGKLVSTQKTFIDEKGNEVRWRLSWNSSAGDSEYTYEYKEFDRFGNWTERIVTESDSKNKHIKYRTITYYE